MGVINDNAINFAVIAAPVCFDLFEWQENCINRAVILPASLPPPLISLLRYLNFALSSLPRFVQKRFVAIREDDTHTTCTTTRDDIWRRSKALITKADNERLIRTMALVSNRSIIERTNFHVELRTKNFVQLFPQDSRIGENCKSNGYLVSPVLFCLGRSKRRIDLRVNRSGETTLSIKRVCVYADHGSTRNSFHANSQRNGVSQFVEKKEELEGKLRGFVARGKEIAICYVFSRGGIPPLSPLSEFEISSS